MELLGYFSSVIVALFFFLSWIMKISSLLNLKLEIMNYNIVPIKLIPITSYFVLILELGIVIFLIFDLLFFYIHIFCIIVLLVFSYLTWRRNEENKERACSCFGNITILNRFPITRNFLLVVLVLISLLSPKFEPSLLLSTQFFLLISWTSLLIKLKTFKTFKYLN
ncbi:MauE/DoxX family redox-associated membrane protein [Paenibacillus alvei]|uniref:MauE/DoxX family redox-associated membrane protein n=1 Tax=Paenibacillus alvei TaxID=44250 RepID=UPI0039909BA4